MKVDPYLNFNGTAEEAFNLYKSVFGGEFVTVQRFKDVPGQETIPGEENRILHIALPIGKDCLLMASDSSSAHGDVVAGTNVHINISPDSKAETDRIFNGLSAGGKVTMPLATMFWGDYFGMCTDKYGIQWMVNYQEPKK
jgi:PhnB protein